MATFISTVKFTDQGARDINATYQRAEAFKNSAESIGVEVRDIFWTLGPFDGLLVFDAPDDETATALMLRLSSFGNVRTQTARAYQSDEMKQILGKLSN